MACNWQLKGQGAANLVFAYCGDDPQLHGHVLRVRKPSAHVASTVDRFLWNGVLDAASGYAIVKELEYMSNLMAPLLGHEYVFPGVPIPVPEEIRGLMAAAASERGSGGGGSEGGSSSSGSSFPALVQPDHTTFNCGGAPGYVGVGPAVCLEIKPKWGLDPREAGTPKSQRPDASGGPNTPLILTPTASAENLYGLSSRMQSAACLAELDKLEDSAMLRQRYPRYMLHLLYKHIKKGVPLTLYNPLDLFSGQLERMEGALWCLVKSPSNNLSVFKDGAKVYGTTVCAVPAPSSPAAATCSPGAVARSPRQKPQLSDAASLQRLASELQGFVAQGAPEAVASEACAAEVEAVAGEPAAIGQEQHHHHHRQQQQQQPPCGSMAVLGTVVRLTALALQQEGVMGRLQQVQALDEVGAKGALELYQQLVGEVGELQRRQSVELLSRSASISGSAPPQPQPQPAASPADPAEAGQYGPALAPAGPAVVQAAAATVAGAAARVAAAAARAAAAVAVADATTAAVEAEAGGDSRLPALRQYLMSATAKDCGIMVTLQRAVRLQQQERTGEPEQAHRCGGADDRNGVAEGSGAAGPAPCEHQDQQQQQEQQRRPWVRLLTDPGSGQVYMYKVAFVDLDIKAASKIPKHYELEQSLLGCARENLELLQELAEQAGWRR